MPGLLEISRRVSVISGSIGLLANIFNRIRFTRWALILDFDGVVLPIYGHPMGFG
jgi:hypothetical protein